MILRLCDLFNARCELQDILESKMSLVTTLAGEGRQQDAIDLLQVVLEENAQRDWDGWLEWRVVSQQASLLAQQGKLNEALEKYRHLSTVRCPTASDYLINQVALFDTLDALGSTPEGVVELEQGLDSASGEAIPTALMALGRYADLGQRTSIPVPVRYRKLLSDVLGWWGIEVPTALTEDTHSLGPAILFARDAHRRSAIQFQELLQDLWQSHGDLERESAAKDGLRRYAQGSPVGFYRREATRVLTRAE